MWFLFVKLRWNRLWVSKGGMCAQSEGHTFNPISMKSQNNTYPKMTNLLQCFVFLMMQKRQVKYFVLIQGQRWPISKLIAKPIYADSHHTHFKRYCLPHLLWGKQAFVPVSPRILLSGSTLQSRSFGNSSEK